MVPAILPRRSATQALIRYRSVRWKSIRCLRSTAGESSDTQAYQPHADRAIRTFTLANRQRLIVTDELQARQAAELWWFLHTEAKVKLNDGGRTAVLSQHGKTFTVHLQEPADAVFQVMDCRPLPSSPNPEPQADNRGRRKLALHLTGVQATCIQVSLEP